MAEVETFAKSQLKALIERIERLEDEKQAIADDIKEVYAEAKAHGFDTKALRVTIKRRKVEASERAEFEAIVNLYGEAVGLGPLFDHAEKTKEAHIIHLKDREKRRSGGGKPGAH